jgi:hypothetical protein
MFFLGTDEPGKYSHIFQLRYVYRLGLLLNSIISPALYGTLRFLTGFIRVYYLFLSLNQVNPDHTLPSYSPKISLKIILPSTLVSSK